MLSGHASGIKKKQFRRAGESKTPHQPPGLILSPCSCGRCRTTPRKNRGGRTRPRGGTSGRATWCSASTHKGARTWMTHCRYAACPAGSGWSWASTSQTSPTLSARARSQTWRHAPGRLTLGVQDWTQVVVAGILVHSMCSRNNVGTLQAQSAVFEQTQSDLFLVLSKMYLSLYEASRNINALLKAR